MATPSIQGINTAISQGGSPEQIQALLLQGDPPPDINEMDSIGLAPIYIASLIPEGLYRHTPVSVYDVLVAAGASECTAVVFKVFVHGEEVPISPYSLAAYAKNAALIQHINSRTKARLKDNERGDRIAKTVVTAVVLACMNANTSGSILNSIPKDMYPELHNIYLDRMCPGASSRGETLKVILKLEKSCRPSQYSLTNLLREYRETLEAARDTLRELFSNSMEERDHDLRLIQRSLVACLINGTMNSYKACLSWSTFMITGLVPYLLGDKKLPATHRDYHFRTSIQLRPRSDTDTRTHGFSFVRRASNGARSPPRSRHPPTRP